MNMGFLVESHEIVVAILWHSFDDRGQADGSGKVGK
jgi:hypothetical protein